MVHRTKYSNLMCSRCVYCNYMSVVRAFKYCYTGDSFNQAPASVRTNTILEKYRYLKSLSHRPSMPRPPW